MLGNIKFIDLIKILGCVVKIGFGVFYNVLSSLFKFEDVNLFVGFDISDDVCVYKINDNIVVI